MLVMEGVSVARDEATCRAQIRIDGVEGIQVVWHVLGGVWENAYDEIDRYERGPKVRQGNI
jgi:hypothetical protein